MVMVSLTWRSVLVMVVVTGAHDSQELVVACTALPKETAAARIGSRRIVIDLASSVIFGGEVVVAFVLCHLDSLCIKLLWGYLE